MTNTYVSPCVAQAWNFLDHLFEIRNYDVSSLKVISEEYCFIQNKKNNVVLCIIVAPDTKSNVVVKFSRLLHSENIAPLDLDLSKGVGLDCIKSILTYCQLMNIHTVILIANTLSVHADGLIYNGSINIQRFCFAETLVADPIKHHLQATHYRVLTGAKRAKFIANHPNYEKELGKLSVNDTVIKMLGFRLKDIISYHEKDHQCGILKTYCMIFEAHERKRNAHSRGYTRSDVEE
jgi:hypothetical protein